MPANGFTITLRGHTEWDPIQGLGRAVRPVFHLTYMHINVYKRFLSTLSKSVTFDDHHNIFIYYPIR